VATSDHTVTAEAPARPAAYHTGKER
jgi:hypothetical protein